MKRSMDDLLRDALRARAADWTTACVDADTAAAFVDGTLSASTRSVAEAHIADCARCQAMLAALVRSTPPAARAWWRRPSLAWLVPAAAAAGLAIWINGPGFPGAGADPAVPVPEEAARLQSSPIQAAGQPPAQPQIPAPGSRFDMAEAVAVREAAKPSARPQSVPSPSGAARDFKDLRQRGAASLAETVSTSAAAPQAALPDAAGLDATRLEAAPSPTRRVETVTVSGAAPVIDVQTLATFKTSGSPTIVSSNRISQWRVGTGGEVEHSADGGKTWQSQDIGAKATPVAGASPSPSVCWLVGRAGLVLLTTDQGQSWRRVAFPVGTDLVSVTATDDRNATVVASDGRTFVTADAGGRWLPN